MATDCAVYGELRPAVRHCATAPALPSALTCAKSTASALAPVAPTRDARPLGASGAGSVRNTFSSRGWVSTSRRVTSRRPASPARHVGGCAAAKTHFDVTRICTVLRRDKRWPTVTVEANRQGCGHRGLRRRRLRRQLVQTGAHVSPVTGAVRPRRSFLGCIAGVNADYSVRRC